ncbi:YceI family protein [Spongiivirga citrea]|uniref:Polyisoprenoid-binding protein n=1 Tax=Spongiivirga citrea TaxID=1481457 RepID=A0A6M0CCU2_9FLAO|nr:YceI family protein [Spongiivirga citrea]NER15616.1 polyisoprenoid-binding protein [Spongiivirga citrea]
MKNIASIFGILAFVILSSISNPINAQVDDEKASITFLFVSKDVEGTINDLKTDIKIDESVVSNSYMKGSVGVTTIKTGNFLRDGHLMWKKYFYEKAFPKIEFESTAVSEENGKLIVTGILTLKETSKTVEIEFEKNGDSLKGETTINCYDFGVKIDKNRDDNEVKVYFDFPMK